MRIRTLSLAAACLVVLMLSVGSLALVARSGGGPSATDDLTRTSAVDRGARTVTVPTSAPPRTTPKARLPFASGLMDTLASVATDPVGAARSARSDLRASGSGALVRPGSSPSTDGRADEPSTGWPTPSTSPSGGDSSSGGGEPTPSEPTPSDPGTPGTDPSTGPRDPAPSSPDPEPEPSDPGLLDGLVDGLSEGLGLG